MSEAIGFPEFKRRKDRSYLQVLNRVIIGLLVVLFIIGMLACFYPALKARAEQKTALAKIKADVEAAQILNQKNLREVARLRNDPEYLGLIARDKLELMKPGETIFRFDSTNTSATPTSAVKTTP
ncbi:MAG: septum formation initiator family protein [Chthoniobacterales bacterium]